MHRQIRKLIEQSINHLANETDIRDHNDEEIENLLSQLDAGSNHGNSFSYIFDHARGKFVYLGDNAEKITGCSRVSMLNSKLSEFWDGMLPVSHGIILSELNIKCFETVRREYRGRTDIRIFMDYVFVRKDGRQRRILTSIKPLVWSQNGALILGGGYFTDITHWKSDGQPMVTINCDGEILHKFEPDTSLIKQGVNDFTSRELEILQLIAKGSSMEDVINKTGLSKATVYTHRRNILSKSELPSIPQVVRHLRVMGVVA